LRIDDLLFYLLFLKREIIFGKKKITFDSRAHYPRTSANIVKWNKLLDTIWIVVNCHFQVCIVIHFVTISRHRWHYSNVLEDLVNSTRRDVRKSNGSTRYSFYRDAVTCQHYRSHFSLRLRSREKRNQSRRDITHVFAMCCHVNYIYVFCLMS